MAPAECKPTERNNYFPPWLTFGTGIGYNGRMTNPHYEGCCAGCGRTAPIDACMELCVSCEEGLNAQIDERTEADNRAFADACDQMTPADWDADNDWLASAGWGEM